MVYNTLYRKGSIHIMSKEFQVLEVDGKVRPATERENYHLNKIRSATIKNKFFRITAFVFLGFAGLATGITADAVFTENKINNAHDQTYINYGIDPTQQQIDESYKNVLSDKQYGEYTALEDEQKQGYIDDILETKRKEKLAGIVGFIISMLGAVASNVNGRWNDFRKDLHIIDFVNDKKVDKTVRNIYGDYQGLTIEDYLAQYNLAYVGDGSTEDLSNELLFADEIDYENLENNERDSEIKRTVLDGLDAYLKGCEHGENLGFPDGYIDAVQAMIKHSNLDIQFEEFDKDEYKKQFGLDNLKVDYKGENLSCYTDGRDCGYVNGYLNGYIACLEQFKEQLEEEQDKEMIDNLIAKIKKEGEDIVEEVGKMQEAV